MSNIQNHFKTILAGQGLSEDEMSAVITDMMDGKLTEGEMGALFMGLAYRGETVDELTGAAKIVRSRAAHIKAPEDAVDCCGTGGDGANTYNISTAVAFVAASCGVPVAKHGNRSASSKSGATDALEAAGINIDVPVEKLEQALKELNFCFLMAPHHHKALKHAVPVRRQLGFRTISNLIGPLANPANTNLQLIGVFDTRWIVPVAETLNRLGTKRAWVVHGSDGLDEITLTGATHIAVLDRNKIHETTITPDDFGLEHINIEEIKGGGANENAEALLGLLNAQAKYNAYIEIVCANTAAVLHIHNADMDIKTAAQLAKDAIHNGKALKLFEDYKSFVQA